MSQKIKILYVDDEPDNLLGFKASLRMDYNVLVSTDTSEALKLLNDHPDIKMVFCDQRMPDKTGVEFFEGIRISHPLPVRILLTAYTDVESIIDAINKGNIFRYVKKPWAETDIISAISEAEKFHTANAMLYIKNEELQIAYDELNKFAYSVSHDIRGPLSGILGGIEIASDIDDLEEMKEMLFLMKKSLQKLDTYILSMHDYYSLQRGELKIEDISFDKLLAEMKEIYSVVARAGNVNFITNVQQNQIFRSDKSPLKMIFNNLISNAFKYQDRNSKNKIVEVSVDVADGIASISIKDTGIGILGQHIGEIFSLFYRANSQEVGSGFGLYNVKGALLKLNGQIEVNSVMHKGTTFKITIPSI